MSDPAPPPASVSDLLTVEALQTAWRRLGGAPLTPRDARMTALRELRRAVLAGRFPDEADGHTALDARPSRGLSTADRVLQRALLDGMLARLEAMLRPRVSGPRGRSPVPALRVALRALSPAATWEILTIDLPSACDHLRHAAARDAAELLDPDPLWLGLVDRWLRVGAGVVGRGLAANGPLSAVLLHAALHRHLDPWLDGVVVSGVGGVQGWARHGESIVLLSDRADDTAPVLQRLGEPLGLLGLAWHPRRAPLHPDVPRPALGRQLRLIDAGDGLLPSDVGGV